MHLGFCIYPALCFPEQSSQQAETAVLPSSCHGCYILSMNNKVQRFRESERSDLKQFSHYLSFLTVTRNQEKGFSCFINF